MNENYIYNPFNVENGHYDNIHMPFGLKIAPDTFMRTIEDVIRDLQEKICNVNTDDIFIMSASVQANIYNHEKVFQSHLER